MPELPEVKTIQDQLNTLMPFDIGSIELSSVSGSIVHTPLDALAGQQIVRVERKGKLLNFIIANGWHILSHLGMSGSWLMSDQAVRRKHTHLQFKGGGLSGLRGSQAFWAFVLFVRRGGAGQAC